MTLCEQLRPLASGIASLPEGDPERLEFMQHAQVCPDCLAAFREGEKLMRVLDASRLPEPSTAALQRASAPIIAELEPRKVHWSVRGAAAVLAFFVPVAIARHLEPSSWTAAIVVLVLSVLLASTAGVLRAGALVVLAASAAFALAAGGIPGYTGPVKGGEIECTLLELISAALPLAAGAWMFRRDPRPGSLAQAAAAGALAGQAALHLACPGRNDPQHLWMFHVSGVILAAVAGWVVERQVSSARS